MTIYNWERIKHTRIPYDDGSMISIKTSSSRGRYKCVVVHMNIINKINPKSKFAGIFYSKKGFLGMKFSSKQEQDSYVLRPVSKVFFEIRSTMLDPFESRKYFEKDVKIEEGMAIVKTILKNNKIQPATYGFKINEGDLRTTNGSQ